MSGAFRTLTPRARPDLSHNKITNHGARMLAKLLGTKSVLMTLNLADNQIHSEGGRYLGRALRHNESLCDLNLRLNRLGDDGGAMVLQGVRSNSTLDTLNLSWCVSPLAPGAGPCFSTPMLPASLRGPLIPLNPPSPAATPSPTTRATSCAPSSRKKRARSPPLTSPATSLKKTTSP